MSFSNDSIPATEDRHGHGTHVAGIIGAKHNIDEMSFSGVCQNIVLASLRVVDATNQISSGSIAEAINYAEQNDIPILNLSIRVTIDDEASALRTSISNYSGLICCAAGNDNCNTDIEESDIPAQWNYDNIISVGASTSSDTKASFSNYGRNTVDIFAPGDAIVSTFPQSLCATNNCSASGHVAYGYHRSSGSSMAAPFVTGVAALILAHNPYVMPSTIKSILINSVDHIYALSNICVSGGRLNAFNALSHVSAHNNVACTYLNASQHQCICQDCGLNWTENHDFHPVSGNCIRCYLVTN